MAILNNTHYIIVQSGIIYKHSKILSINCNDKYQRIPEHIIKTYTLS